MGRHNLVHVCGMPNQTLCAGPGRPRRVDPRMCGIIGIFKHEGNVNVELYEGLLMLQHRGQDSAGMVTTDWEKFKEYKENGLVKDVFANQNLMDSMKGGWPGTQQEGLQSHSPCKPHMHAPAKRDPMREPAAAGGSSRSSSCTCNGSLQQPGRLRSMLCCRLCPQQLSNVHASRTWCAEVAWLCRRRGCSHPRCHQHSTWKHMKQWWGYSTNHARCMHGGQLQGPCL